MLAVTSDLLVAEFPAEDHSILPIIYDPDELELDFEKLIVALAISFPSLS
jgi:hypothetical protein